ncbi:hypothetical protein EON64_02065 [archaeon]|nr:MAG: hypothetical protein EON64_02065 [archaeon]
MQEELSMSAIMLLRKGNNVVHNRYESLVRQQNIKKAYGYDGSEQAGERWGEELQKRVQGVERMLDETRKNTEHLEMCELQGLREAIFDKERIEKKRRARRELEKERSLRAEGGRLKEILLQDRPVRELAIKARKAKMEIQKGLM